MSTWEPSLEERQERIQTIFDTISPYNQDPDDPQSQVADLLADLMHWCRGRGFDFEESLRFGRFNFEAEVLEALEGDDEDDDHSPGRG